MNRRELLRAVSGLTAGAAGCLDSGAGDPPDSPPSGSPTVPPPSNKSAPTDTPTATPGPCDRAFTGRDRPTADCHGTAFDYAWVEPASTATTEPGETPRPSTFHDYVEIRVVSDASDALELRGCVHGMTEEGKRTVAVSQTLPAGEAPYERRFGPFTHHGVEKFSFWIRGCAAYVRWP